MTTAPVIDADEMADVMLAAVDRVTDVFAQVVDHTRRIPTAPEWTVHDLAAHMAFAPGYYLGGHLGTSVFTTHAAGMADVNAGNVVALRDRPLDDLVELLRSSSREFAAHVRAVGAGEPPFAFHAGSRANSVEAMGLVIGELNVHGWDLAGAVGVGWDIPGRDVELALRGLAPLLPAWLDEEASAGHTASYEIRLRGQGVHRWRFDDGVLTTDPDGPWSPDAIISAAPGPVLLVFYQRASQWTAIARGQMFAWGRKPWLALGLARRFQAPDPTRSGGRARRAPRHLRGRGATASCRARRRSHRACRRRRSLDGTARRPRSGSDRSRNQPRGRRTDGRRVARARRS
ncbi:MAG: maleylpyruvate isomerase family mycothiol-dependent enzyme [Actinobacteria bacterium]|nr:maleylpyruvate isomerase family mycothiol-dependent enzyme [Actinomycetota bacterium]